MVYIVLQSSTSTGQLSREGIAKLQEFNLRPGRNEFSTETGKCVIYITSSKNGWMMKSHCASMASVRSDTPPCDCWTVQLSDNWHGFDDTYARVCMENRKLSLHTPPKFSLIYNTLDVDFHGSLKGHQNKDRARDRADPTLLKFFRTSTGQLKTGTQELTLHNLVKRFTGQYNSTSFVNGMKRITCKTGYGLPLDGSQDHLFLSHLFGYEIGKEPDIASNMPMGLGGSNGINPFKATAKEIVEMKMKSGRKKHVTGMTCFNREYVQGVKRKLEEDKTARDNDPRIPFLQRVKETAAAFAAFVKKRFCLIDFLETPFEKQVGTLSLLLSFSVNHIYTCI